MEIKVPPAGESITTVMVSEWLVEEGDSVEADQILLVLETDKINVEVPAPAAGVLSSILKGPGQEATVGEVIGHLSKGAEGSSPAKVVSAPKAPTPEADSEEETIVSPAARRLLEENGLTPEQVQGTGKGGRILKEDVLLALESNQAPQSPEKVAPVTNGSSPKESARPSPTPVRPASPPNPAPSGSDEVVKMSPLRRKIAERLVEAQQTAAILSTFNEVDMSAVMRMRKQYGQAFQEKHGVKLGFMSFFVKACVEALKAFPAVNAEVMGDNIIYKNRYDIGVAVGGGKGLVVPVLRNADRRSFAEIELAIRDLALKAKDMKLTLADLEGGTFTISNGGIYGSMLSTPILNPPQSGILGLHNITERPVAINGQVEIRPMMYLALSYDHRIVDGREAVSFLVTIKSAIEDPGRLLLEV